MNISDLNQNKMLSYFDSPIKILTIYDHHLYDRSDYDSISKPQRSYLENQIQVFEPQVKTGRITYLNKLKRSIVYPKPSILGSSPFDILRYEKRDNSFIYVLTPTQAACYFLTLDDEEESIIFLKQLLEKHPINTKKIEDYIRTETNFKHRFLNLKNFIYNLQSDTVERIAHKGQTHLGKIL